MVNEKAIKEFQDIYERKVEKKLTKAEAEVKAENFLRLCVSFTNSSLFILINE